MNKTLKNILIIGGSIAVGITVYYVYKKYGKKAIIGEGANVRMSSDTNEVQEKDLSAESKKENTIQFTR